jgi:hypothetical protein
MQKCTGRVLYRIYGIEKHEPSREKRIFIQYLTRIEHYFDGTPFMPVKNIFLDDILCTKHYCIFRIGIASVELIIEQRMCVQVVVRLT